MLCGAGSESNDEKEEEELLEMGGNQKPPAVYMTTCFSEHAHLCTLYWSQERTPGVGREEGEEEGGGDKREEGGVSLEVEEVKRKIAELELRIEVAVSEEVENYDLAGQIKAAASCA